jgi:SpoVK/Ycf46/Vps4 family AAA+-type ATPase
MVDSLHLQDLYDSARWYIYTEYCDVLYLPKTDSLLSKSYGEIELKFYSLFIKNDTAKLSFDFIDKGEIIMSSMTRDNRSSNTGVGFDLKTRKKIYESYPGFTYTSKGDPKSRYENPLQPEVLKYIRENWDKLDNCFRELAKQKGITR